MTDAAIISGSLVDAKNVNTHKVMRLIIDVPAENALKVIAAFGWPTMVNPVSVAVARLNEVPAPSSSRVSSSDERKPESDPGSMTERGHPKKSPAQIAGYLSTLPSFHKFLSEKFPDVWFGNYTDNEGHLRGAEDIAAESVRDICAVRSRRELNDKNTEWHALQLAFKLWQNHPELEDA